MKMKLLLWLAAGAAVLAPATRAQVDVSITADIRVGRTPPPPPPEVVVIDNARPPGPPPWASAWGFRRSREYYYYPAADVYYRPADRVWFYLDGGKWRMDRRLPATVYVDFGRSVPVSMRTDRPYEYDAKVRAYYPRDYFVSRVRVRERPGRPDWHDSRIGTMITIATIATITTTADATGTTTGDANSMRPGATGSGVGRSRAGFKDPGRS